MTTTDTRVRVAVVGGGYAGAMAAVRIAGRARGAAEVSLIEPRRALIQRLRLHQAATGQAVRSYRLDKLCGRRVAHIQGAVSLIDQERMALEVAAPEGSMRVDFDYLILANGSSIDIDSAAGARDHAHALAGPEQADRLQAALRRLSPSSTVAVVGGGMTGVETVAEIADRRRDLKTLLLTARPLGNWLSVIGQRRLAERLHALGVRAIDGATVVALEAGRAIRADDREIGFDLAIWCGGFVAQPLARDSGLDTDSRGRVLVDGTLRSRSQPNIVAAGDAAAIPELPNGAAYRMTCQAGMPAGAHAADTVLAMIMGKPPAAFDFGYLHQPISLGRRDGLIQWVDRADRPKETVWCGRKAATYKELVTRGAVPSIRMERRMPGLLRWPSGGEIVRAPLSRANDAETTSTQEG